MKNLFIILLLLIIKSNVAAQDIKQISMEPKMFNNAIYGSVGLGLFVFPYTVYYERMFQSHAQKSIMATFLRAGYGGIQYWGGSSTYIVGNFGILTGVTKHHLEVSGGLVKFLDDYSDLSPFSFSIGYRKQKPGSHFIFRTGIGWPEAVYLGLGVSF